MQKIKQEGFSAINLSSLPSWSAIMGLQFENLVLNNRQVIHQQLRLHPEDIVLANPYYQRATQKHPGCQIDYLIQTRFKTLFVCEIKFSINTLDTSVIKRALIKSLLKMAIIMILKEMDFLFLKIANQCYLNPLVIILWVYWNMVL